MFVTYRSALPVILVFCIANVSIATAKVQKNRIAESQLLGKWMGHRDIREFLPDHTFMFDDQKKDGMRWHVEGSRLILVFPELPGSEVNSAYESGTFSIRIVSVTKDRLITADDKGRKFVAYKLANDTPEERDRAATAARLEEQRLNTAH